MKNTKLGNCVAGNFSTDQAIREKDIEVINKKNNILIAKTKHSNIRLTPKDKQAEFVVLNFSGYPDEDSESIYTAKVVNESVVVILYLFKSIQRIETESETRHFYLDRLETNRLIKDKTITEKDETDFLKKDFLDGRSVFVIDEYHGRSTNKFQMFGNKFIANCEHERPGVIKIATIRPYKVNNSNDEMTQWFGNIRFVKFDDAMRIRGNDIKRQSIQTDDIFLAWHQYLDFKKKRSYDEIRKKGFLRYEKKAVSKGELLLTFTKEIGNHPLFLDLENDRFDMVLYDEESASLDNMDDILSYKDKETKNILTIGECVECSSNTAKFIAPDDADRVPPQGILILSDRNMAIEQRRRREVVRLLNSRTNPTVNMIMRLTAGEEDSQTGGSITPVSAEVLDKMFGDKNFKITENYREAMNIAINTPDLALIQGPPGTGKTTLIRGIVARLNSLGNKNYKILVSSEQHEALFNVVEKLSANKLIPPFIASKKYEETKHDEDSGRFISNVENFQKEFINYCDELLNVTRTRSGDFSAALSEIIYLIQKIRSENYLLKTIKENLPIINDIVVKKNIGNSAQEIIKTIYEEAALKEAGTSSLSVERERIVSKIKNQRVIINSYLDDGAYQLKELHRLLRKESDLSYFELNAELMSKMQSGDRDIIAAAFDDYIRYVENLKEKLLPKEIDELKKEGNSFSGLFDKLSEDIKVYSKNREKDFNDIVEELKYKLLDIDNIVSTVKRYTNIIGSTCAQAKRSVDKTELSAFARFDYVIIDEAARANPLDIMIPIMLGTRVILVGDQMQLPHFVETKEVREFAENQDKQHEYDGKLLEKSLFGLIYERVEKSWNDKKLSFKRHVRISEQHRMHPVIGDFINKSFYDGGITNGVATPYNINEYNVFDGKNVVWQNVPITCGLEEGKPSYFRDAEVLKVVEILSAIIKSGKKDHKIGIISFYKKQIDKIKKVLEEKFTKDTFELIECDTVDSFQGKEFDVVILSTVRSNTAQTAGESLGFIHYSKSRVNVSLSRAKRLLIVVGDADTVGRNKMFYEYIKYVKAVGYYG